MISAVIHTYNEEKNIDRCLSSLTFCDEKVVIDMGSNDKTYSIVEEHGAKIYNHPYTGFVEPARNFGIEKARGEWILIVDADEEIPITLSRYLLIEAKDPKADFYRIPRKNIIFGKWIKHAGWWPDYQIRFFKKGAVSWTKDLHGIPLTYGEGVDLEATEQLAFVHHNYQSLEQFLERLNRYTTIAAKEFLLSNKRFQTSYLLEKPTKEFINRYFFLEGYKDGIHGLALSLLQSFSELVTYLKLWELNNFKEEKVTLKEVNKFISGEYKEKNYWLVNKLLQEPHNILQELVWRLKRKIASL